MTQATTAASTTTRAIPPAPILLGVPAAAEALGPEFPPSTLRDFIYHAEERIAANGETIPPNGFADCVVRINGKVLLDWGRLLAWIESNRGRRARKHRRAA